MFRNNLKENYVPMYHLGALGSGGLAISFFLYLNFLLPHESGIISFDQLWPVVSAMNSMKAFWISVCLFIVFALSATHIALIIWNTREFSLFKQTEAYSKLRNSSAEISLMVVPLTQAMTVNVLFVTSSLLIPGMWDYIEYMFPLAMLAFVVIGIYGLRILGDYFVRMLLHKGYSFEQNNSLAPMVSIFCLSMIAVGLAAPAAMSHVRETVAISIALSGFFATSAALLIVVMLVIGFHSMLTHGIRLEAAPSLWLMIPITTLLGITFMRTSHGLGEAMGAHVSSGETFAVLIAIFSIQLIFGMIGFVVMKRLNYFRDFIHGDKVHATTYALVCPGVALPVFGLFVVKFGLMGNTLVTMWTPSMYLFLLPFLLVQLKTLQVLVKLLVRLQLVPMQQRAGYSGMQGA